MDRVTLETAESVEPTAGFLVTARATGPRMNAQHVRFGPAAAGIEHSHPQEQIVYVTGGSLVCRGPTGEERVDAGDSLVIPGGEPHAAANPGDVPTEVIEIFSPRRENPPWAA